MVKLDSMVARSKSMHYEVLPGVAHVLVHSRGEPSDEEFADYLNHAAAAIHGVKGLFIHCEHGAPNTRQREMASTHWEQAGITPQMSVVTTSRLVRGTVTALSWFIGKNIRAFDPSDLRKAAAHLEIGDDDFERLKKMLGDLAREAGVEISHLGDIQPGKRVS